MMSKLVYFMALVALVALLACGGDDAAEAPAVTASSPPTSAPTAMIESTTSPEPAPTNTPVPAPTNTPVPVPTNTPMPVPTQEPPPPGTGAIRPLQLDDPLNVAGELSESELACASGVADLGRLMQIFSAPEQADPDELSQLINCMEDETVLRLFITELVGLEEPLSDEASACVRGGLEGVDARNVILAGMAGDAAAAMTGSMTSFLLVLTCLSDEEFAAAAPALGVPADDRDGMLCLIGELGGPEMFAAALSGQDEEAMMGLLGAAIACGLDMEGGPMPGATTIAPPTTMEPETGTMPGMPGDPFASVLAGLSAGEIACLGGLGISPEMLQDPSAMDSATPEQQAQVVGCFNDETLTDLFVSGLVGDPSQLSAETSACIQSGMEGIDLRGLMTDEQAAMVGGLSAMFLTIFCLSDDELLAAWPILGMTPDDLICVMEELGGPEGMATVLNAEDVSGTLTLFGATFACGLDLESLGSGG